METHRDNDTKKNSPRQSPANIKLKHVAGSKDVIWYKCEEVDFDNLYT